MNGLQSVSIMAAFPIGIVIILITASCFKDAKEFLDWKVQNWDGDKRL